LKAEMFIQGERYCLFLVFSKGDRIDLPKMGQIMCLKR
jgi:hypothetical protein